MRGDLFGDGAQVLWMSVEAGNSDTGLCVFDCGGIKDGNLRFVV